MNGIFKRLQASGTLTFWLIVMLLIIAGGITSIVLPIHYARARRQIEPELTVFPKNTYERTLLVVGDADYKPFSYLLHDQTPHGYDVELVAELANRLRVNIDLCLMNWSDAVTMIQDGQADLILGCDWQDSTVMDCSFTIPTFEEKFVVFELTQSSSFSDLYSKKIAVIEGCGLMDTLIRYDLWKNCREYETVTDCVRAVLDGECDCFIAHSTIGEVSLRSFGRNGNRFRGRMDIASGQMCFGVAADDQDLFASINEILLAMRADGTMDNLDRKWLERFNREPSPGEYLRNHPFILFMTIDLLVVVLLIILVMNYYLIRIKKEKDRAIAAERSKSFFFSTVSHDIRTPLNAIIGYSELLKHGIKDEAEQKHAVDAIASSGQTLLDLVNDVLDLSKLDAGKTVLAPELIDFRHLASGVLHSFDVAVSGGDVKLEEDIGPIPPLFVDPHRIRQILFNLIGNAVKFTEHGKIVLSARFEKNPAPAGPAMTPAGENADIGVLTVSVSDTGCGIPPEDLDNILKPYVQARNSGAKKGTGLGLSICCQLSELMGGRMTVKSTLGKGSTFSIVFPSVRFAAEEDLPRESTDRTVSISLPVSGKLRVLLVDDVPVNAKVIQAMLRRMNVSDSVVAENGKVALEMLRSDPAINLVLTDMWMPVLDGDGLIREIRSEERWKDLPVYAVTADVEVRKSYRESGFTGILLKPVTFETLRALICSVRTDVA